MAKDIYIGNTDHDWFEFCAANSPLSEVNFWQPSRQHFKALDEGGIFFFRRKAPINKISGFAVLASSGVASIRTCWEELGISNDTRTDQDFLERVRKYNPSRFVDVQTLIGFKILVNPVFLKESEWFDVPSDWSQNIVSGKSYDSMSREGERLLSLYRKHQDGGQRSEGIENFGFSDQPAAGYSVGQPQKVRMGQSRFKFALLSAYDGKCAVTGCAVQSLLEAAHILPFAETMDNDVTNGILLRCDIHTLFDRGLLHIDENYTVLLNDNFRQANSDEKAYLQFHGRKMKLPMVRRHRPSVDKLALRLRRF